MIPTPRLLALLLLAAPLLGVSALHPALFVLALAYLFALAGALLIDLLRSPRPRGIAVEREVQRRLSLGAENPVTLTLRNRTGRPLAVHIRDEAPAGCEASGNEQRVQAAGVLALRYTVRPRHRGLHRFGGTSLRYPTELQLLQRQATYPTAQEVAVYPNLRDVQRYDLAARRGLLAQQGLRPSRRLGQGNEFERLRDYHQDDDYRRINWPATARRHRPVTVDYQTERAQNVLLLLDVGRLMAAPVGPLTKLDHAINTCLLTCYACLGRGDNVGLVAFADRVARYLQPKGGKGQFHAMLETLYNLQPQATESDYQEASAFAGQRVRKRSLAVMLTDVVSPEASASLLSGLLYLGRRHLTVCATLADPEVVRTAQGPVEDSVGVYRRAVALDLMEHRRHTLEILQRRGTLTLDVAADALTPALITTYLDLKAQGRL